MATSPPGRYLSLRVFASVRRSLRGTWADVSLSVSLSCRTSCLRTLLVVLFVPSPSSAVCWKLSECTSSCPVVASDNKMFIRHSGRTSAAGQTALYASFAFFEASQHWLIFLPSIRPSIFTRDSIYAIARICYRPSVCPSVCLSHGWISQKRLKLGSCNFHHTVAHPSSFVG